MQTRHRLQDVEAAMTNDGRLATLVLHTSSADPFPLEIEVDRIDELIASLLLIAKQSGDIRGVSPSPKAGDPVAVLPVPTDGVGAMPGPPGHALLVFRVGCIDLAMQIENSRTTSIGRELAQLGVVLEQESPHTQ